MWFSGSLLYRPLSSRPLVNLCNKLHFVSISLLRCYNYGLSTVGSASAGRFHMTGRLARLNAGRLSTAVGLGCGQTRHIIVYDCPLAKRMKLLRAFTIANCLLGGGLLISVAYTICTNPELQSKTLSVQTYDPINKLSSFPDSNLKTKSSLSEAKPVVLISMIGLILIVSVALPMTVAYWLRRYTCRITYDPGSQKYTLTRLKLLFGTIEDEFLATQVTSPIKPQLFVNRVVLLPYSSSSHSLLPGTICRLLPFPASRTDQAKRTKQISLIFFPNAIKHTPLMAPLLGS